MFHTNSETNMAFDFQHIEKHNAPCSLYVERKSAAIFQTQPYNNSYLLTCTVSIILFNVLLCKTERAWTTGLHKRRHGTQQQTFYPNTNNAFYNLAKLSFYFISPVCVIKLASIST